jgi:hypothetical protein
MPLHLILIKIAHIRCTIHKHHLPLPMLLVILPIPFILIPIGIGKHPKPLLIVRLPLTIIFLPRRKVIQLPFALTQVVDKPTIVVVAVHHVLFALTVAQVAAERALKDGPRCKEVDAFALEAVVLEVPHVDVPVAAV